MPTRRTKRGAERTPLAGDYDVLICGASFAGLAVARELGRARARACCCSTATRSASARPRPAASPPSGCEALGLRARTARRSAGWWSTRRTAPRASSCPGPSPPSTTRELCALLCEPERRRLRDRQGRAAAPANTVAHRPRRPDRAAGRRRARLAAGARLRGYQPPDAPLSRGLEVHPCGRRRGAGDLDRPRARARRLRLELPGRRRAAHRRRLLRPALPRQGPDGAARRGPRARRRSATRATGSRTGCAPPPRTASSSPATPPATACR